ncbi:class I adenylate-forming enzyme family protein [Neobacillus massiliamazoniensis]|uniref:AMP-dependent synthetase and ligase n=1 Tax=Neobacillus massiliamazoniensis TaxID=1499688 RepID=A0A0U1P4G1_9BACI|nr:class I adenylate-forming enzyme family protein [Neobacillus massiliamazoniensis]CRK85058.1 AMP-dependent synthetase and ligase [Neobacillus massiliamazoniensis]
MPAWKVNGVVKGMAKSWRDQYPELNEKVEKVKVPFNRGIQWEGAEIYAYKDRPKSITEVLEKNIKDFPDKEAYIFHPSGTRMTWREMGLKVNSVAYSLRYKYDYKKGDRLAIITGGSPEYIYSFFGAIKLGGIAVPINLGLSAEGIATQVNKVRSKILVVSPYMWEKVKEIRDKLHHVEVIFVTGNQKVSENCVPFSDLLNNQIANVSEEVDEWDLCAISFTSGTTGSPKGTMTLHSNALACAQTIRDMVYGLSSEDVNICMPPLYHNTAVYCDIMPALLVGAKSVVMEAFSPLDAIKLIEKEKATFAVAAPIMLTFIMNHPEFKKHDCSSLTKLAFGGHASSESFINQLMKEFSLIAAVNAGSVSESTATGFGLPTEDAIRKITSCGLATACTEITVFDEEGNEITEPNQIGEVAYKGQQTNAGYWEDNEKTNETFRKDGYVLSGDWAKIDEEGYLWLLDRKKDMIVRGGQNVYCIGVENQLYLNDKVLRAAVVGVPDHLFAERVKAVIVLKPGQTSSPQEIREYCSKLVTYYEVPEYVVFAKELPANPAGKVLKQRLVDFWGELDEEDKVVEKFHHFMKSVPSKLLDRELIKIEETSLTPNQALEHLKNNTDFNEKIAELIKKDGIVGLLKPDEARFKKSLIAVDNKQ